MKKVYASKDKEQLNKIDEFAQEYHGNIDNKPIQWYTARMFHIQYGQQGIRYPRRSNFTENRFFHARSSPKPSGSSTTNKSITNDTLFPNEVYRGQVYDTARFSTENSNKENYFHTIIFYRQLQTKLLPLISFGENCDRTKAKLGVLFMMNIDPSIKLVPYARIAEFSHFPNEKEILFSHTPYFASNK